MHLQAQVQCPAPEIDREMDVMAASSAAAADKSELSPAALETTTQATAAAAGRVKCEGVVFTVTTEGNEVAQVAGRGGGAARVLGSVSFLDAATCTRHHFVDVQGKAEAMLFLVSVREDQRRIVDVRRFS